MLSSEVAKALLKQVDLEFQSERQYIAMEFFFKSLDLNHYAKLFNDYAMEERNHAFKILNFLDDWNYPTNIGTIGKVETSFESPRDVFEKAYKHEQFITKSLKDILVIARETKDNIAIQFLD